MARHIHDARDLVRRARGAGIIVDVGPGRGVSFTFPTSADRATWSEVLTPRHDDIAAVLARWPDRCARCRDGVGCRRPYWAPAERLCSRCVSALAERFDQTGRWPPRPETPTVEDRPLVASVAN